MAITVVGSGSAATNFVTIPAHAVGDLLVIAARATSTIQPTIPAAGGTVPVWTTPTNQTGANNTVGWRVGIATATATNHTSGTWTNGAHMHALVLRASIGTLAVGNAPANLGANNTQTILYPAITFTAGRTDNLVIRYGARTVADTEVRTDGAFAASGTFQTEQPATTPSSATFTKPITANEAQFTATPAGTNAAYRAGSFEIVEDPAPTVYERSASVTLTPDVASAGEVETPAAVHERSASVTLTPEVVSAGVAETPAVTHERSASVTITPFVASAPQRVRLRSASVTLTPGVASSASFLSIISRSAAVTISPVVASAPQRVRIRSASVTLTPGVASAASFFSILSRSAAVTLTPTITAAPQRVLLRRAAVTITPAIFTAGQIEGGIVTHNRSASVTITPAIASAASFYSILSRSAAVTLTPGIASKPQRVRIRAATVTLTPAVSSSATFFSVLSRSAAVTLTPGVSSAAMRIVERSASIAIALGISSAGTGPITYVDYEGPLMLIVDAGVTRSLSVDGVGHNLVVASSDRALIVDQRERHLEVDDVSELLVVGPRSRLLEVDA